MKYFIAALFFFNLGVAQAADQTLTIEVGTMACGADPHTIKNSLAVLAGVKNVKVSLPDKTATITFDDQKSSANAMLVAVASAGYAGFVKSK
jgi:periplasmic mercuric ion binding protein